MSTQATKFSITDHLILAFDQLVRITTHHLSPETRANPAEKLPETELSDSERKQSIALMRINYAGEVAAQALYQGQATFAREGTLKQKLYHAADEENDHLHWCYIRLQELGGRTSYLDPFWYIGAHGIGMLASYCGDKWSLGFLAETENQVIEHLDNHLLAISHRDQRSRAVITQMKIDEGQHATLAIQNGAVALPLPIKWLMRMQSKVMTTLAYWV